MAHIAKSDCGYLWQLGFSAPQSPMSVCYRIQRLIIVLSLIIPLHGEGRGCAITRKSTRRDDPMFTRAQFLRLSSVAVAALAVAPDALSKANDGVVRVKSAYSFQDTVERLKRDIAAKGI